MFVGNFSEYCDSCVHTLMSKLGNSTDFSLDCFYLGLMSFVMTHDAMPLSHLFWAAWRHTPHLPESTRPALALGNNVRQTYNRCLTTFRSLSYMTTSIDTFDKEIILYNINGKSQSRRLIYLMEVVVAASEHHQTSHTCLGNIVL